MNGLANVKHPCRADVVGLQQAYHEYMVATKPLRDSVVRLHVEHASRMVPRVWIDGTVVRVEPPQMPVEVREYTRKTDAELRRIAVDYFGSCVR